MQLSALIKPCRKRCESLLILLFILCCLLVLSPSTSCSQQNSDTIFLELENTIPMDTMGVGIDITICGNATVFVSDSSQSRFWVIKARTNFAQLIKLEFDHYVSPKSISCARKDLIWVANPDMHEVLRCSYGKNLLNCKQNPPIRMARPISLASDAQRFVHILDQDRLAVVALASDGRLKEAVHEYPIPSTFTARKLVAMGVGKTALVSESSAEMMLFYNDRFQPFHLDQIDPTRSLHVRAATANQEFLIVLWDSARPLLTAHYLNGEFKQRLFLAEAYLLRPTAIAANFNQLWIIDEGKQAVLQFKLRRATTGAEHAVLGEEYLALSHEKEAVREFETADKMGFTNWENHLYWGQALFTQNYLNTALEQFILANKLKPFHTEVLNCLGTVYEKLGELDKAIEAFSNSLRTEPRQANIYHRLGILWWKRARFDLALKSLTTCLHLEPQNKGCRLDISRLYIEQGGYRQAIEYLKGLQSDRHVGRQARYFLGLAYLKQGDAMSAISYLTRSSREGPFYYDAFFALGRAYEAIGQKLKAQGSYRRALEIRPNAVEAQKALQALEE